MAKNLNIKNIMSQGMELVEFYRQNPCIAAYDLCGVDLAPIQRVVFEDMWFKNYVIGVMGRGNGKSQSVNSLSFIDNEGLFYLHEKFPKIPSFLSDGDTMELSHDGSIYTSDGFKSIENISLEKNISGLRLKTKAGFENKGSHHHPLLTINEQGTFCYKQLQDFKIGDYVCIQRGQDVFGEETIPPEDAYLIGLFIGDGLISNDYNFQSITTESEEIKKFCINYCKAHYISYRIDKDKRTKNTESIIFKKFKSFFEKYNIKRCLSYHKEVPKIIRSSDKNTQINFLRGLFDTDGGFEKQGIVTLCSTSKKLIKEIQIMLLNFGIIGSIRKKKTNSKFGKAHVLTISGEDIQIFNNKIGFNLYYKQKLLNTYIQSNKFNTNKNTIPFIKDTLLKNIGLSERQIGKLLNIRRYKFSNRHNLTYNVLNRLLESSIFKNINSDVYNRLRNISDTNYYFDKVKSIKEWSGDCYDFEIDMEEDVEPNYFSNGFINHNTFLQGLLAVLSSLLYPGYRVGLIAPTFRQCFFSDLNYLPIFTNKGMSTSPMDFYNNIDDNTSIQSLKKSNKIIDKWLNVEEEGLIIKTEKGFEIGGLYDHYILTIENASLTWKKLKNITKDDYLVIKKGFELFGNNNSLPDYELVDDWRTNDCIVPKELTLNMSYLFGLIVGDGCVSYTNRKYRINFTSEDDELLESFKSYMDINFGIDQASGYVKENITKQIEIYNKNLCNFLITCGFTTTTALDKKIPSVVNKANKENVAAFLSGLMDTDGGVNIQRSGATVDLSTSSLQLAKEVQAWFLNFGIMSSLGIDKDACKRKLNNREKYSNCATSYKVRITNVLDMIKFRDSIGFRLLRKKNLLDEYINSVNMTKVKNSYVVPNCESCIKDLVLECTKLFKYGDIYPNEFLGYFKNKFGRTNGFTEVKIKQLLQFARKYNVLTKSYYKLKKIIDLNLAFVKPKEFITHKAQTIDIEVENEHCYFAGGFINHNSKMMFSEVEKLYAKSNIVRQAAEKKPTRATDTCFLKFKAVGGYNGSYIEALPLGVDGAKIRGSRFYLICIDELAQVPDKVLDLVVRPFAAVSLEPMEKVRRLEQQKKLIEQGLATEEDFEDESVNKMVMTSSGFFKFNHMWRRMKQHWEMMDKLGEESKHVVHQVPYWFMPAGFLELASIEEAKRTMSSYEFMMEYEAAMITDSEGFFKASLLEECTRDSGFEIELRGKKDGRYVIGVDPNQGGSASCGVVVIKLGEMNKVVNVLELKGKTTQQLTGSVQDLCKIYNVVRIFMDQGGGGKAIMDLLDDGYNGYEPIIDRTDKDKIHKEGRHILEMVNFTPSWIADANFSTLSLLEDKRLRFPEPPVSATEDSVGATYETINLMKSQMLSIIVTQTASGLLHFDTPKKGQNKDLYSAIILAASGVRQIEKEMEIDDEPVLHNSGGMIRYHTNKSGWSPLDSGDTSSQVRNVGLTNPHLQAAVLKKKIK